MLNETTIVGQAGNVSQTVTKAELTAKKVTLCVWWVVQWPNTQFGQLLPAIGQTEGSNQPQEAKISECKRHLALAGQGQASYFNKHPL